MTEFNCYQKSSFQIKDSAGEQWEKPNMTKNAPRGLKKMFLNTEQLRLCPTLI